MNLLQRFIPQTLLARTFLLISLLISVSVATWATLFTLAEHEPHARQLAEMTVSVVNLTNAALVAADPAKRQTLLRDFAESEGVHIYPAEPTDDIDDLPDTLFFRIMTKAARVQLGADTRFAGSVNGQEGIWVSFSIDNAGDDYYWLMLPSEHAQSDVPWKWLGWGGLSLALALLVARLIASRITYPLRSMSSAASEVGQGKYPAPITETGAMELRQLAQTFNRMSRDLQRMESERAEVLAGISHDLRTPLARLRLESEMSISCEEARLAVIEDIEQMDTIIAQFLDYARGESGEPFELSDINDLVSQLASSQRRNTPMLTVSQDTLPPTLFQRKALTRALLNLIENARKYGGGEFTIETRSSGNEIIIDILDRGPGIPPAEVERMKRPFTRLENARTNATGTGLGLAIVDRIIAQQRGRFELLERAGGGLIARVHLPIRTQP